MKAMISGTFDPVTVGHVDLIRRAAALFDEVHAVVFNNTGKACRFSLSDRTRFLAAACEGMPNVTVGKCSGLLAGYAKRHGIGVIVRGIRDVSDVPYEMSLATINRGLYFHISSSFVRDMLRYRQELAGILPDPVLRILKERGEI